MAKSMKLCLPVFEGILIDSVELFC